jgi:hypothetical protein
MAAGIDASNGGSTMAVDPGMVVPISESSVVLEIGGTGGSNVYILNESGEYA